MSYYAHTTTSSNQEDWQTLEEHLCNVAGLAASFSESFAMESWAYAAGSMHDYGKACDEFQRRLLGRYPSFDHAIAGVIKAQEVLATSPVHEGSFIGPIIAGHHGGLMDYDGGANEPLSVRIAAFRRGDVPHVAADPHLPMPVPDPEPGMKLARSAAQTGLHQKEFLSFGAFTLGHLVFSALVDADWLDTESVMSPEAYALRSNGTRMQDTIETLASKLDSHLATFRADTPINEARAQMLADALSASRQSPGLFTLEMPTGAGKTLTSMAFALNHALQNGQQRVIYAIPFQSIVEQNAEIFKKVLGAKNVIEHVSSYDYGLSPSHEGGTDARFDESGRCERMLTQNWDAPVVVTTNVQLFESLFSHKASKSRKVHNIANSVIVLDEVQTLPDSLLKPTLAMLETLVKLAHVSVVLCSATQPALDELWPFGSKPSAIVSPSKRHVELFERRVEYDITRIGNSPYTISELSDEIASLHQVLCVVSSRRAARMLYDSLSSDHESKEGIYHLSALMMPAHRAHVLDIIRARLVEGLPCTVVSTQLVEAGVDLDFPVVYREMAGIDSVLQAAGRCNREGRLSLSGHVVVFACEDFEMSRSSRKNWLSRTRGIGEAVLRDEDVSDEPFGQKAVARYFERRHQTGMLDGADGCPIYGHIVGESDRETLTAHAIRGHLPYRTISERYRFILDETISVFIPWKSQGEDLLHRIEEGAFYPELFPLLQRYSVSLPIFLFQKYKNAGAIRMIENFSIPILETRDGSERLYDDERGLLCPGEGEIDNLIVI